MPAIVLPTLQAALLLHAGPIIQSHPLGQSAPLSQAGPWQAPPAYLRCENTPLSSNLLLSLRCTLPNYRGACDRLEAKPDSVADVLSTVALVNAVIGVVVDVLTLALTWTNFCGRFDEVHGLQTLDFP